MSSRESGALAGIYAEALYEAAAEAGQVARVGQELHALAAVLPESPSFGRFLETPVLPVAAKRQALVAALRDFSPLTVNVLCVLLRRRRVRHLEAVAEAYRHLCNERAGLAEVEVDTAAALQPEEGRRLTRALEAMVGRTVTLSERVRPELLGGFTIRHKGRQWQLSLSHRLEGLVARLRSARGNTGLWHD